MTHEDSLIAEYPDGPYSSAYSDECKPIVEQAGKGFAEAGRKYCSHKCSRVQQLDLLAMTP